MKDAENHHHILSCLRTLGPFVDFAGILLVQGDLGTRVTEEDHKTIRWVQCFCGPELFKSITIVTTKWDLLNIVGLEQQWRKAGLLEGDEDIAQILDPPGYYHGGEIYHHGFPGGKGGPDAFPNVLYQDENAAERSNEVQELIIRRYGARLKCQPQIMTELANGVAVMETEAAKVLRINPLDSKVRIIQDRAVVEILSSGGSVLKQAFQPLLLPPPSDFKGEMPQTSAEGGAQPKPEKSWSDSIVFWLEVACKAARYFQQYRDSRNSSTPKPSWGDIWTTWKSWWRGNSEK